MSYYRYRPNPPDSIKGDEARKQWRKAHADPAMPQAIKDGPKAARFQWKKDNWRGHAYGLGQLIPETGAQYGGIKGAGYALYPGQPGESYDPVKNIKGTVAFLSELMRQHGGDKRTVYAIYNAGAGHVKDYGVEHFATYINASLSREAQYHAYD